MPKETPSRCSAVPTADTLMSHLGYGGCVRWQTLGPSPPGSWRHGRSPASSRATWSKPCSLHGRPRRRSGPQPGLGAALRSKEVAPRQRTSLGGPNPWHRRVGQCPQGCATPQVAPLDEALGVQSPQRTSGEQRAW